MFVDACFKGRVFSVWIATHLGHLRGVPLICAILLHAPRQHSGVLIDQPLTSLLMTSLNFGRAYKQLTCLAISREDGTYWRSVGEC